MITIGFLISPTTEWLGGINYFRNLFCAIDQAAPEGVRLIAFVPADLDEGLLRQICAGQRMVEVVRTKLLIRGSVPWLIWRLARRLTGSDLWLAIYLRRYRVEVFSHSWVFAGLGVRAANWIPDFQHVHLPELFPGGQAEARNRAFREVAKKSDAVFLSSQAAADDFCKFAPAHANKAVVLRFVSQAPADYWEREQENSARVRATYGLRRPFIYLPNQFWQHKNHRVAFDAFALLTAQGVEADLVCTGTMNDHRNAGYLADLKSRLVELEIGDRVRLLGVVPYADVYALIAASECVVNPSRFEGWSSTVEECRAVGKRLVLSDIPVHREQSPGSLFFPPDDFRQLAKLLAELLSGDLAEIPKRVDPRSAQEERTRRFALHYLTVVRSLASRGAPQCASTD